MGRGGIEKVLQSLADYLPATFNHPDKIVEDCDSCYLCMGFSKFIWNFGTQVVLLKNTSLTLPRHQDVYKMSVHT